MQALTLKQEALQSIERLNDDADIDEIIYRLYVVDKLRKSREALANGQFIDQNDFKRYAMRVIQDIVDQVETLTAFPNIGRVVAEIGEGP